MFSAFHAYGYICARVFSAFHAYGYIRESVFSARHLKVHVVSLSFLRVCCAGAEHGGDPVSAGVRVLCAAAGVGEEQRLLRVHPSPHRPLPHAGVWEIRRDCCESVLVLRVS